MKKRLMALILALVMTFGLSATASAHTDKQLRAAEALYHLGLFLGRSTTTKDFDLDSKLNRAEGVLLLVRMLGKEEEASAYDVADTPFADVAKFWDGKNQFIAYAYQTGMVKGMSDTQFGPRVEMNDRMFLTLVLRVLGYDEGREKTYVWDHAYQLAYETGLVESTEKDAEFTRGDAVLVCWKALDCKILGGSMTLGDRLMAEGLFDAEAYAQAKEIWATGILPDDGTASDKDDGGTGGNSEVPGVPVPTPSPSPEPTPSPEPSPSPSPDVPGSGDEGGRNDWGAGRI